MGARRHAVLLCLLAVGCGGPLLDVEEEQPRSEPLAEFEDGAVTAQGWSPVPGRVRLVEDIFPPSEDIPRYVRGPEGLVSFRGRLFFSVDFEDGHRALGRSDGTAPGTYPVKEFPPSGGPAYLHFLSYLTPVDGQLFFVVGDEVRGSELWVSDGTRQGTRLVANISPRFGGWYLSHFMAVRGRLLFFRSTFETPTTPARVELWRSDGTTAGTVRVLDFGPESSVGSAQVVEDGTLFISLTTPRYGSELWRTDGTARGTTLVADIVPGPRGSSPGNFRAVGRRLFFTVEHPIRGLAFWRTDGTAAGTTLFHALPPGEVNLRVLEVAGKYLYFARSNASAQLMSLYRLKVVGSRRDCAERVAILPNPFADQEDAMPYITEYAAAGGRLFFGLGIGSSGPAPRDVQLWVTDGTARGTEMLYRPLSLSDEYGSPIFALDGSILFVGFDAATGLEPWVSDGTVEGTRLLQDIASGPESSYPRGFTRVGRQVFFTAFDPVHGNELRVLPLHRSHSSCEVEGQER
jgi:ELWxxDGT repeat protein